MQFINAAIDTQLLPRLEEVPLKPVHHHYLRVLRIEWLITSLVLVLIAAMLIYFIPSMHKGFNWAILAGAALLIIGIHRFSIEKTFPFLAYAVREKDILSQKGWITRTLKACPHNRIQNCSVQSGPLERKFGLASLTIYTAGSNSADMKIPGLLLEEAEQLRHFILEKIHAEDHEGI